MTMVMRDMAGQLGDDPILWLQLARSRRVGPATFHWLVREHGSVTAALAALPVIAAAAGVANYEVCPMGVVRAEAARGAKMGARLLLWGQGGYPPALMDMADAPPVLWALGDEGLLARPAVAMVGARNASSLGLRMARALAAGLGAAGQVVVSGLARGIDAAAHAAALGTGTIAVQAGGLDVIYPEENAALTEAIGAQGLRLSEHPFGMAPQARHFPQRNRIVAGLARAVVVVEAAAKSGSLITARDAADLGRDVLAVPGHPFDARAAGCNGLIRDGAVLVRSSADVIEALGLPSGVAAAPRPAARRETVADLTPSAPPARNLQDTSALHQQILSRLGPSPVAEDQLLRDVGAIGAQMGPALVALELDGLILRHAGGLISRAH
ncbi:MAG: DNA-processing protein DprA [Cypionkella sp.]|nr:DNA-processing protein DprA [Cypionkella sp.]